MSHAGDPTLTGGLRKVRAKEYEGACRAIAAGDLERASLHVQRVELIDRLARLVPATLPVFALALACACGALTFTAWRTRMVAFAALQVSIQGETTAAQIALARPAAFERLRGAGADVARLSALGSQIGEVPQIGGGDGWIRVLGGDIQVANLHGAAGSRFAFALQARGITEPALAVRANGLGIGGDLLVRPGALVSGGASQAQVASPHQMGGDVSDVVTFGCQDCDEAPLRLDVERSEPFAFRNVPVSRLAFAVEEAQPDGTVYFTSGLVSGSIRLLDVDRTEAIARGDNLKLELGGVRRFQIGRTAKENTLSFLYEGALKDIRLGPVGAERDLSPSVLEFLYRQKALALLWGGGVFLWSLLAGLGRLGRARAS